MPFSLVRGAKTKRYTMNPSLNRRRERNEALESPFDFDSKSVFEIPPCGHKSLTMLYLFIQNDSVKLEEFQFIPK